MTVPSLPTDPPPDPIAASSDALVATLLAYGTDALDRIERERLDNIADADTPRLVVTSDVELKFAGQSPPQFDATGTFGIVCIAADASRSALVAQLDRLAAQVKDALLSDAAFVRRFTRLTGLTQRWQTSREGEVYVGRVQIILTALWRETYPPRIPDTLRQITLTASAPPPAAALGTITIET